MSAPKHASLTDALQRISDGAHPDGLPSEAQLQFGSRSRSTTTTQSDHEDRGSGALFERPATTRLGLGPALVDAQP